MYLPEEHNFVIQQGQDWQRRLAWKSAAGAVYDLSSGYTAKLVLAPFFGFKGTIPTGYRIGSTDSIMTSGAEITLSVATGTPNRNILLAITDTVTAALDFERGQYTLELVSTATSKIYPILRGYMYLLKEATN